MKQAAAKNRFGKIKTCIGTALCVVFGFLLICNLTILIKGTLNPEKPPSVLGVTPMVVLSGSMSGDQEDHIEIGDLIFISKADPEKLEVGDIIAFMSGKTTVTHRITAVTVAENGERLFTTKGDANNAEDIDPVTEDQLIGIYRVRIPKVGDFALFCSNRWECCCLSAFHCWLLLFMISCAASGMPSWNNARHRRWRRNLPGCVRSPASKSPQNWILTMNPKPMLYIHAKRTATRPTMQRYRCEDIPHGGKYFDEKYFHNPFFKEAYSNEEE